MTWRVVTWLTGIWYRVVGNTLHTRQLLLNVKQNFQFPQKRRFYLIPVVHTPMAESYEVTNKGRKANGDRNPFICSQNGSNFEWLVQIHKTQLKKRKRTLSATYINEIFPGIEGKLYKICTPGRPSVYPLFSYRQALTLILTDICEIVYEQHVAGFLNKFENLTHLCSAMPEVFLQRGTKIMPIRCGILKFRMKVDIWKIMQ